MCLTYPSESSKYSKSQVYDGDQVIAEYDGSGTLLRKFIYGPGIDEPICMITCDAQGAETGRYFYHFDGLGSVVALSQYDSGSVSIVEGYIYDAFGKCTVITSGGTDGSWLTNDGTSDTKSAYGNPYQFTARRYDNETGLYYYRARMYKPDLGRFLQPDPIGYDDGMNIYAYCGNNPINFVDPMGLCKKSNYANPLAYRTAVLDAENFLRKGRNSIYIPLKHGEGFEYDFGYNKYKFNKFRLPDGTIMTSNEFGNYFAGYMGAYHGGNLGYGFMRLYGNVYENRKNGISITKKWYKAGYFTTGDCEDSIRDLKHGRIDGVRQKYKDYQDTFGAVESLMGNILTDIFKNLSDVSFH